MRERITVTSEVQVYGVGCVGVERKPGTATVFRCGSYSGPSFADAVESAIRSGDCNTDTRVILDGRDLGNIWSLGFQSIDGVSAAPTVEQDGQRKFVAVFENGDCLGFDENGVSNLLDFREHVERYSLFFNEGGRLFPVQVGPINWGSDADNPNVAIRGSGELLVNGRVVGHVSYNEH